MLLYIHRVRRGFVGGNVQPVVPVVLLNRSRKFLFGQPVILIRHPDVPQDIGVTGSRHQPAARQLRVVIVGPDGNQFKFPRRTIVVHLKVVVIAFSQSVQVARLERHAFGLAGQLVQVGVKVQPPVPEVIDGEFLPLIVRHLLTAYRAHRTDPTGEDAAEGILLVMVIDAVFLHALLDVLLSAGKHQTGAAIFLRIDVAGRTYREQAGVKLGRVARVSFQRGQPLPIAKGDFFPVLAAAHVHRLPLNPPFHLAAGFFGNGFQRFVAVHTLVVYRDQLRTFHRTHLPVSNVAHAVIDCLHHHGHMLTGRGRQGKQGVRIPVRRLQHQEPLDQALHAVQLQVIVPLALVHLLRRVAFRQPVPFAQIVRVVVHVQDDMFVMGEGKGKHIVSLNLLLLGGAVIRSDVRTFIAVSVIYGQHVRNPFKYRLNCV